MAITTVGAGSGPSERLTGVSGPAEAAARRSFQVLAADRWARRFDLIAGGRVVGDPDLTKQMRWLPPGTPLQPCPAARVLHGVLDRCDQPGGHPSAKHRTANGVVFEVDDITAREGNLKGSEHG